MSPRYDAYAVALSSFPRVSGDEPSGVTPSAVVLPFSPRERG